MAYDLYRGDPNDEKARVQHLMTLFMEARARRSNFETLWEEAAAICWPEFRNTFMFGNMRSPGAKQTEFQLDATAAIASHRFMSVANVLLTPDSLVWTKWEAGGPDARELMRDRSVQLYYHERTQRVWEERYRPEANFAGSNQRNLQSLGVFGNMGMFVDELDAAPGGFEPGLRYISTGVGEVFLLENHQGRIDGLIRWFRWTPRQALQRWGEMCPEPIQRACEQNSQERFDFLQFILPRTDYDIEKVFAPQGKPYSSCYVSIVGQKIMEEGGYRSFPWAGGRYMQADGEIEGRGPAQMVGPELKTLQAEKGIFLAQGHMAAKPPFLIADDGMIDFKIHPNAYLYGGLSPDGTRLIDTLPPGNVQITKEMMDVSREAVNDAFLVSLYPLLFSDKGRMRTAREMVEAANDRAMFLTPLARQFGEYIGPMAYREVDVLTYLRKMPPVPPVLLEARAPHRLKCTGPLARALSGQPIAGFFRTVELAKETIAAGGSPDIMDIFDFEIALPEIAEEQFVPPRWMSTQQKLARKRKARRAAAERDRQVKELPGRAAILKAQAISDKAQAGMNTGGVLSGTPEGGMPMLPGQTEPGGRSF